MGTWEDRTTHARFQNGDDFRLVRQPVLTVMQLMSELKKGILDVYVPDSLSRYFGIIPTVDETGLAILVYNKTDVEILNDRKPKPEPDFELQAMKEQEVRGIIEITELPFDRVRLQHFRIDSVHANPYALWKKMGSPAWPEEDLVDELNEAAWPVLLNDDTLNARKGTLTLDIYMPSSSVSLYLLDVLPN